MRINQLAQKYGYEVDFNCFSFVEIRQLFEFHSYYGSNSIENILYFVDEERLLSPEFRKKIKNESKALKDKMKQRTNELKEIEEAIIENNMKELPQF